MRRIGLHRPRLLFVAFQLPSYSREHCPVSIRRRATSIGGRWTTLSRSSPKFCWCASESTSDESIRYWRWREANQDESSSSGSLARDERSSSERNLRFGERYRVRISTARLL